MTTRPRQSTARWTILLLSVGGLLTGPPAIAKDWGRQLRRLESTVEKSQWKEALDRARDLRRRMLAKIPPDQSTQRALARTLMWQAIAEANLGRDQDALWHWHAAENYLEGLPGMNLTAYGRAAEILAGRDLDDKPSVTSGADESAPDQRVKTLRAVKPSWPPELAASGYAGSVTVKVIVTTDGKPLQPVVQDGGVVPSMAFPALEALSDWRFAPAVRGGQAIPVYYELKIHYP